MTETLVRVGIEAGRYEGLLTSAEPSGIEAVLRGQVVAAATLDAAGRQPGTWRVLLDLPAAAIGEGVQVITLRATAGGAVLDRIAVSAGSALDDDIFAEIALLREELEMLKRAMRRHAADTAPG